MINTELEHLNQCKKLIENKLGWIESTHWKQRDYNNLIQLIENETGVILSLSTIKRIWNVDFDGNPHPSTLDALALFLDYENWLEYKNSNNDKLDVNENENKVLRKNRELIFNKKKFVPIMFVVFSAIGLLLLMKALFYDGSHPISFNSEEVVFSCNNSVSEGVPNTIMFNYDVSKVEADSFFIQQKWNENTKYQISKQNNFFSTIYYIPGYHKAKLVANDSIIKEIDIRINTNRWVALSRQNYYDNSPVYIDETQIIKNGYLHVSEKLLNRAKVNITNQTLTSCFFVTDFEKQVSSANFQFEVKLKCDSIYQFTCPRLSMIIIGQGKSFFVPLIDIGCTSETMLKLGNNVKYGETHDLSDFGVNVYQWHKVNVAVKNNNATIFIDDKKSYEASFEKDVGNINGFSIHFTGAGMVDYIWLKDDNGELVYYNNFDSLK